MNTIILTVVIALLIGFVLGTLLGLLKKYFQLKLIQKFPRQEKLFPALTAEAADMPAAILLLWLL